MAGARQRRVVSRVGADRKVDLVKAWISEAASSAGMRTQHGSQAARTDGAGHEMGARGD